MAWCRVCDLDSVGGVLMQVELIVTAVLLAVVTVLVWALARLKRRISMLERIAQVQEQTIENYKTGRVTLKEALGVVEQKEEALKLLQEGKSKEEVAKALGVQVGAIETMIKLQQILDEQKDAT